MKYVHHRNTASHFVTFPGFSIEVSTEGGAAKLVGELNGLNEQIVEQGKILDRLKGENNDLNLSLTVQIDAKNKALNRVADLERQLNSKRQTNERLGKRCERMRAGSLVMRTALEDAQKVLAYYLEPHSGQSRKETITELLDILDQQDLVKQIREAREEFGGTKAQIISVDECAGHPSSVEVGVEAPGTIYAAEIGEAMAPAVTYQTINHFAPVLKRKDRAAIEDALTMIEDGVALSKDGTDFTTKRLKKLLKRF